MGEADFAALQVDGYEEKAVLLRSGRCCAAGMECCAHQWYRDLGYHEDD